MSTRWGWFDFLKPSSNEELDCISPREATSLPGECRGGVGPRIPKLLSADGGWKDMKHVSFFQVGATQIAQGDTVQQNERIVLYLPV